MASFLKRQIKSLLPKGVVDREALTRNFLTFKPRFSLVLLELKRLKNILYKSFLVLSLGVVVFGTSPITSIPVVTDTSVVYAQSEEKHEIIASSFAQPVTLPHPGYLSTKFSSYHPGVDIAVGYGTPIHPISAGTIEQVNFGIVGYGNNVVVNHGNGFKSMYAHMGKVYVRVGEVVSTSDMLGTVGMTGRTTGPHTHLEIYYNDKAVDPQTLLPAIDPFPTKNIGYLKPVGGTNR